MDIKRISGVAPTAELLSASVPEISAEQLDAVMRRSRSAGTLCHHLQRQVDAGTVMSRGDVEEIVRKAQYKDGRCNPNHAVVLAYYARHHGEVFGHHGRPLVAKLLNKVEWTSLMLELASFMEKLRDEAREAEKKRELEKERFEDDVLKPEERRAELKKENGTIEDRKAERVHTEQQKVAAKERLREASIADVDDELTGSGQMRLSDSELAKLALLKKGFANRG